MSGGGPAQGNQPGWEWDILGASFSSVTSPLLRLLQSNITVPTPIRPGDPQWLDGRSNVVDVDVVFIVVVAVAVLDVAKFTANTAIFRRRRRRTPAIRFSLNRWRENGSFVGREMSDRDRATVPLAEKRVDD